MEFAGSDAPSIIDLQSDEESRNRLVEPIKEDREMTPVEVVVQKCDEAVDVTPARGPETRNSFGDLIGRLDPGKKPIKTSERADDGIRLRRVERHYRSLTCIVLLLFKVKASESYRPTGRGQQARRTGRGVE